MGYPDRFYSADGFEWHRFKAYIFETICDWRFRPTPRHPDWAEMKEQDKDWDHATEEQFRMWKIVIAENGVING